MQPLEFGLLDYLGPVVVGIVFAIGVFIVSCFSNFCCINENDELTKFKEFGARRNFRLGRPVRKVRKMMANRELAEEEMRMFRGE